MFMMRELSMSVACRNIPSQAQCRRQQGDTQLDAQEDEVMTILRAATAKEAGTQPRCVFKRNHLVRGQLASQGAGRSTMRAHTESR